MPVRAAIARPMVANMRRRPMLFVAGAGGRGSAEFGRAGFLGNYGMSRVVVLHLSPVGRGRLAPAARAG